MPHSSPAAHQGRGSAGKIFLAAESKWELDHLVYAVEDLQAGIEHFHQLTGVEPCIGGQHEGLGTHNAVFSLGDSQTYFEIIAAGASCVACLLLLLRVLHLLLLLLLLSSRLVVLVLVLPCLLVVLPSCPVVLCCCLVCCSCCLITCCCGPSYCYLQCHIYYCSFPLQLLLPHHMLLL